MNQLEAPDSTHLEAAQGWLDLGNHLEANEELERIEAKNRAHPNVLQVRWRKHFNGGFMWCDAQDAMPHLPIPIGTPICTLR